MIGPQHEDDFWGELLGVLAVYALLAAGVTLIGLAVIGAFTVADWMA